MNTPHACLTRSTEGVVMSGYADFWKQIDARANACKKEYLDAELEIKACKGWRFGGCPDGLMWIARHSKHGELKYRKSADLVKEVKRLNELDTIAASGPTATTGR